MLHDILIPVLFAIALLHSPTVYALGVEAEHKISQNEEKDIETGDNSRPHVVALPERLTIAPFFDIPGTQMSLIYRPKTQGSENSSGAKLDKSNERSLTYSHKLIHTFGAAVTYGNVGASVNFQPAYNKNTDSEKGRTEYKDFRTTYSLPKVTFDLFFQRYHGFYLMSNKAGNGQKEIAAVDKIRPDLRIDNTGFISTYVFKDTFAPRAGFDFLKKQVRPSHSPIVSLSYLSSHIRDRNGIVPQSIKSEFGKFAEFNDAKLQSLNVSGGYGVNGVVKDYILHAAGQLGVGGTNGKYSLSDGEHRKQLYSVSFDLRVAVGYNSSHYFSGFNYVYHTVNTVIGDLSLMRGIFSATVVGGMRW